MARRTKKALEGATIVLENARPCAIFLPGVGAHRRCLLVPGENDVVAAHFDAVKDNPAIRQYMKLRWLIAKGPGQARPMARGLDDMSEAEAVAKLGAIDDARVVQDMRDRTQNFNLRELAQIRLREIMGEDEPEATEDAPAAD